MISPGLLPNPEPIIPLVSCACSRTWNRISWFTCWDSEGQLMLKLESGGQISPMRQQNVLCTCNQLFYPIAKVFVRCVSHFALGYTKHYLANAVIISRLLLSNSFMLIVSANSLIHAFAVFFQRFSHASRAKRTRRRIIFLVCIPSSVARQNASLWFKPLKPLDVLNI